MEKSATHQAALRYAERGIPVFPCVENEKAPAVDGGFKSATTDPAQIDAWWSKNPNFNIGCSPHAAGCCVIDVDAPEAIDELEMVYGKLPATFTIQTPRGGLHMWYKGALPPSSSKLVKKIDTRGIGSYVLMPPSVINGVYYKVIDKTSPQPVPEDIVAALRPKEGPTDRAAPDFVADLPIAIQRGRDKAKTWPKAEWGTIDDMTYAHAAELADMGLSEETRYAILKEWYERTGTEGNLERLHTVAMSGGKNRQNAEGVWAVKDPKVEFANFEGQIHIAPSKPSKYLPLDEAEQDALPPPTWLLPGVLPADQLVMLYAPSKGWKTFLALDWGMCIATGNPKWGAIEAAPVVYIAAEGATGLGKVRRPAWRLLHGVDAPAPFHIIQHMPHVAMEGQIAEMIAAIKAKLPNGCKLLVIDTLARFMAGFDESGAKDASITIEALEHIKRELGCTIICLHHTGKDAARGERGSSALRAGFDSGFELIADKANGTAELWARWHKDAETPATPWHLKAEQIMDSMAFRFAAPDEMPIKDRLLPSDIGFVLRTLGVFGKERAVPYHVLQPGIMTMKSWPEKKTAAAFKALAKSGKLRAYEAEPGSYCLSESSEEIPFD